MIGETLATNLFKSNDVVGKQIKISGSFFTVIGVIEDFGAGTFNIGSGLFRNS